MNNIRLLSTFLNVNKYFIDNLRYHHVYKIPNYKSYTLADELLKKLLYYDNDIVVLNKPFGVSFGENITVKEGVTIDTLRPFLKNNLKCIELFPAKVPERYASGIAVFCTNEQSLRRVKKCLRSMRGKKEPAEFYECIVIGQPSHEEKQFEAGITVQTSPNGKQKAIKFVNECPINTVRKGDVKPVYLQHSTLALSECASRLIISTTRTKWHSVRLYAAREIISPILGDHIFGRSVRTVLGKQVLIDLFSPMANQPLKLPANLLSKLELSSRNDIEIPLHLHLSRIKLKDVLGKGKDLEFIAQPPDFFLWTCERLDLNNKKLLEIAAD